MRDGGKQPVMRNRLENAWVRGGRERLAKGCEERVVKTAVGLAV
jgi:hypothetical protein